MEGTKFKLIPDSELKSLGMKRIGADGVKIDFFPTDKINTYDVITSVIDAVGYGEIYVDNFRFAVVERIGQDRGVRLSLRKNLQNLSVQRQTSDFATRIYPYGKDDLTISGVDDIKDKNGFYIHKKGEPYIDSPNKDIYGTIEGYKDYTDYTEAGKLIAHAEWDLMGENNDFRLDTPRLTITGDVIDLSKLAQYGDFKKIALGDTVHVYEGETVHHKRIINITYYPYSAKQPSVTIGVPSNTNGFYAAWQKGKLFKAVKKNTGKDNKWKTKYFTGTVNSTRNPIKSQNGKLLLDGDLLVINDSDTANKRLELGNVDGQFALNIYSGNGETLKIKLGDHGSNGDENYAFAIYDNDGNAAIYMDESGEIIMAGKITSYKSAELYNGLKLGTSGDSAIEFKGPVNTEGRISVTDHEMDIEADYVRINGRDILAEIDDIKTQLGG